MSKDLMNADLRVGEFRLRQRELSTNPIPNEIKPIALDLLNKGFSKKSIKAVLGCSYSDLKRVNLSY